MYLYVLITTLLELRELIDACIAAPIFGLDSETRPRPNIAYSGLDLRPYDGALESIRSRCAGVCITPSQDLGYYVPLQHDTGNLDATPDLILQEFRRLGVALQEKRTVAAMWNSGFDIAVLGKLLGVRSLPLGAWVDGMVLDQFLRPHSYTHDLKSSVKKVLGVEMAPFKAPMREVWVPELDVDHPLHIARRNTGPDFGALDPKDADEYASLDGQMTLAFCLAVLGKQLSKDTERLVALEHEFVTPVMAMHRCQIGYDRVAALELAQELLTERDELLATLAGLGLKQPGSPAKVLAFLRTLGFAGTATDKPALAAAKGGVELHSACEDIKRYRHVSVYINSYLSPLINADHPSEVIGSWRAWGAKSGRMSAGPAKDRRKKDAQFVWSTWLPHGQPRDKRMRALYVAREGRQLLTADYRAQEYRMTAELAQEPCWLATFADPDPDKQDVHLQSARTLFPDFDKCDKARRKQLRDIAKTFNFASIYGAQAERIGQMLGISEREAQALLDRFYAGAPALRQYIDRCQANAAKFGRVYTWFGRPISVHAKDTAETDDLVVHASVNYCTQGSCADLLRLAVTEFFRREASSIYQMGGDDSIRLTNLVHDEIIVEARTEKAEAVAEVLRQCMEGCVPASWSVAMPVDIKIDFVWSK